MKPPANAVRGKHDVELYLDTFDLITDGRSGEPRTAYEYLWRTDSHRLCCDGADDCCRRWIFDREITYGRSGRGFYQECEQ